MPRKPMTFQFDLFYSPRDSGVAQTPQWLTLPAPTRQKLMPLIVRLLLDHATGAPCAAREEKSDDL
ncbi:hypothetical protein K7W03_26635 [Sphingobium sp. PNB]|jgi:hypothetical protein|uniref:hypothetical protein n=1 Tax=Sphingobium sp. PNB TaxID=863934 RepID=UPI001CA41BD0|nr:hypothetical protein [Sphingobium sp. PNB]MCB4863154.1 hypothetical protein [Sphingobium sp. PNB]